MNWIKPPELRPGDTVGIVAPASNIKPDLLNQGCRELQRLGFRTHHRPDILASARYLAGSNERRTAEFLEMMRNPEIRAIVCARGGYGSAHLLTHLTPEFLRAHPKIVVGASDITMILSAMFRAHVVSFHGPMVATTLRQGPDAYAVDVFTQVLQGAAAVRLPTDNVSILKPGTAEGRLAGGCLSLLVSTLGTAAEIDTRGTILVFEDIDVKPYQIDRMLTHLRQAGKFDSVRGIVFGEMLNCMQHPNQGYTLQDVLSDLLSDLGVPIAFGFPTGHTSKRNVIVPFGVTARLTLDSQPVFELLESAVTATS